MSRLPAPTHRADAADGISELGALLAAAVLRLHRRAIDAAPVGEHAARPSAAIPSESSDFGLEVCAPSRPCGPTRVNGSPLGDVPRDGTRKGESR